MDFTTRTASSSSARSTGPSTSTFSILPLFDTTKRSTTLPETPFSAAIVGYLRLSFRYLFSACIPPGNEGICSTVWNTVSCTSSCGVSIAISFKSWMSVPNRSSLPFTSATETATFALIISSCVFTSSRSASSSFTIFGAVNLIELFNGGGGGASTFLIASLFFTSGGGSLVNCVTSVILTSSCFFGAM